MVDKLQPSSINFLTISFLGKIVYFIEVSLDYIGQDFTTKYYKIIYEIILITGTVIYR